MSKILFFGDIYGKPGRRGLAEVLPQWKAEYKPDVVIANVENMAHGKGVTPATMEEISALGIDAFTSGNHVFHSGVAADGCFRDYPNLIRPENYGDAFPGRGWYRFEKNGQWYCIINLNGQVFFEKQFRGEIASPFTAVDRLLADVVQKGDIILVDIHAEATSEKVALGWHVDGRVHVVVGTHTHVPTADLWIMPAGTAFACDVGMTGPRHSVIGVKTENVLGRFLDPNGKYPMEPAEEGPVVVNAILIMTDGVRAKNIERLQQIVI
ncbi:MAG: YmdB family metallophosphoesterase [Candidatus Doudnabacteria bacterium]|nr:YmdB family metallophosphoesterase [Candidatus Doudnabacteria bacterium]